MNIIIQDDQGLGTALSNNGFTQRQIIDVKGLIRTKFKEIASIVYSEVLQVEPPDTIVVQLAQNDNEELNGKKSAVLASYVHRLSTPEKRIFVVREKSLREILSGHSAKSFHNVVIHEMIHSADFSELQKTQALLKAISNDIDAEECNSFLLGKGSNKVALLSVVSMLDHYRAEGVAILGECLLGNGLLPEVEVDPIGVFSKVFRYNLFRALLWMQNNQDSELLFDDRIFQLAYSISPYVYLKVLEKQGSIDGNLVERITLGQKDFTRREAQEVLRNALSLSMSEFIEGLLLLGERATPIMELLAFCGLLENDYDPDNAKHFAELFGNLGSDETFANAIGEIMGSFIPDDELKQFYSHFRQNPPKALDSSIMRDKIASLFWTIENSNDLEKKNIARWALTYLFDDEDVIHDNIPGLGFADDIFVIDKALEIIEN